MPRRCQAPFLRLISNEYIRQELSGKRYFLHALLHLTSPDTNEQYSNAVEYDKKAFWLVFQMPLP